MFIQYSLDENIPGESLPYFPKILFVKDCIEEDSRFAVVVNFPWTQGL